MGFSTHLDCVMSLLQKQHEYKNSEIFWYKFPDEIFWDIMNLT